MAREGPLEDENATLLRTSRTWKQHLGDLEQAVADGRGAELVRSHNGKTFCTVREKLQLLVGVLESSVADTHDADELGNATHVVANLQFLFKAASRRYTAEAEKTRRKRDEGARRDADRSARGHALKLVADHLDMAAAPLLVGQVRDLAAKLAAKVVYGETPPSVAAREVADRILRAHGYQPTPRRLRQDANGSPSPSLLTALRRIERKRVLRRFEETGAGGPKVKTRTATADEPLVRARVRTNNRYAGKVAGEIVEVTMSELKRVSHALVLDEESMPKKNPA